MEHQYLHVEKLRSVLNRDPDLAVVPENTRLKLLQALFIATGCDYVSFAGLGKATFMKIAFQHCSFINADSDSCPGTLVDTGDTKDRGFLAFLRLVGTAYFKKNLPCFQYESPRVFYNSFTSSDKVLQHKQWFESIRQTVWERIDDEDQLPPSVEALWRHWLRTCWVSNFWKQAGCNQYSLLDIIQFGWKISEGSLLIDWDAPENIEVVRQRVGLLLRGCSCKKGCKTNRCSCRKRCRKCGPGCSCCNCENGPTSSNSDDADTSLEEEENNEDHARRQRLLEQLVESDEEVTHSDNGEEFEENVSEDVFDDLDDTEM